MATPPVKVEFTVEGLEQVKTAFGEVSQTSQETRQSVERDSKAMAAGFRMLYYQIYITAQTGRLLAEFAEQMGVLDKATASAITKTMNLISMFGGLMSTLSSLASLTQTAAAAEWLHVAALKAKAVAAAIAHGIASLGAALPLIVAAAAAATAIALAATTQVPSRERGGPIYETGLYRLHAGEYVLPASRPPVNIYIYGMSPREAESTSDVIIDKLRRAGVI